MAQTIPLTPSQVAHNKAITERRLAARAEAEAAAVAAGVSGTSSTSQAGLASPTVTPSVSPSISSSLDAESSGFAGTATSFMTPQKAEKSGWGFWPLAMIAFVLLGGIPFAKKLLRKAKV